MLLTVFFFSVFLYHTILFVWQRIFIRNRFIRITQLFFSLPQMMMMMMMTWFQNSRKKPNSFIWPLSIKINFRENEIPNLNYREIKQEKKLGNRLLPKSNSIVVFIWLLLAFGYLTRLKNREEKTTTTTTKTYNRRARLPILMILQYIFFLVGMVTFYLYLLSDCLV